MSELGLSMYFKVDRIRFRNQTIAELQNPEYIHLKINARKKQLFIQKCEKDKDAFRLLYTKDNEYLDNKGYINAKRLLGYLSRIVGVAGMSVRFKGVLLNDGKTVYIDLKHYQPILSPDFVTQTESNQ